MGQRRREIQESLFIATDRLPRAAGHPFYERLNPLLAEAGCDSWIENRCQQYYAAEGSAGRPSIPPGLYFRMLLVGYFEGLDSQRGIAWRCADSLGLRRFLGLSLEAASPDHSTLTNTRKRLPAEVFAEVFEFVLSIAALKGLLAGKTVGVDSTTLEANAAMTSIIRKDTGEDWRADVVRLMREEGLIELEQEPTDEEVRRYDKGRKNQRVSNDEWQSSTDPESRITKRKDGRTHLAYKAEHVVDLENELVLAAEIYPANRGDADTLIDSVMQARRNVDAANERTGLGGERIEEVAADKGDHAAATLELADALNMRTYIPEPKHKAPLALDGQARGTPEGRHQQPASNRAPEEPETPTAAQRAGRTLVCSHVRDRRRPTELAPRVCGRDEAFPDDGGCAQSGPGASRALGSGQAEGPAGPFGPFRGTGRGPPGRVVGSPGDREGFETIGRHAAAIPGVMAGRRQRRIPQRAARPYYAPHHP
jgi:IS5 family transposase